METARIMERKGEGKITARVIKRRFIVQNHEKLYTNSDNNIRIIESSNPNKIKVAKACAAWLGSVSRDWVDNGSWINIRRMTDYVKETFPKHSWVKISKQLPFDLVSLTAGVAIEIKSMTSGSNRVLTNASIYPNKLKAGDVLPSNFIYPEGYSEHTRLDVLIICVNRSVTNKVEDYAIVDGSYWGFTYRDYLECKQFYTNVNSDNFKTQLLALYSSRFDSTFAKKLCFNKFGNSIDLNFRKLITLTNPVGRLDLAGWWKVEEGE